MNKRKLLILVDWFYPGFRGGGPILSILNLVYELHSVYDIYILTSIYDYKNNTPYEDIAPNTWINFKGIAKVFYTPKVTFNLLAQCLQTVEPHIIYLNSMYSRQFTILPLLYCRFSNYRSLRIVLAPRGMLLKGKLQFFKFKKLLFLKLFVGLGFQKALCVQVTSLEEKSAAIELLRIAENQVRIVPNIAAKRLLEDFKIPTKNKGQLKIYFSSRIAHEKNLLFALNIVEQLNIPIEFDIFGVIDHEKYWEKCLQKIQKLPSNISLNYKGEYNPTKIGELFESYHAFFFPTFGENYGHVIIEALSMGKPVVTTPTTPWSDMEVNNAGWVIDLKDEKKYQAIFLELFEMEQREYAQYAKAAYEYATRKINEVDYVQQYQKLFG